jgi:hypothetical protein
VARYRKKPVVIDAERVDRDKLHRLSPEFRAAVCHETCEKGLRKYDNGYAMPHVHTLEGALHVSDGDWLVKGVQGEFYPVKPAIFAETYESAD